MFIRHSRPNFSPYHIPSDSHRYVAYIYVLLRLLPRIARTHITFPALEGPTHNPIFSFFPPPFFQRLKRRGRRGKGQSGDYRRRGESEGFDKYENVFNAKSLKFCDMFTALSCSVLSCTEGFFLGK